MVFVHVSTAKHTARRKADIRTFIYVLSSNKCYLKFLQIINRSCPLLELEVRRVDNHEMYYIVVFLTSGSNGTAEYTRQLRMV